MPEATVRDSSFMKLAIGWVTVSLISSCTSQPSNQTPPAPQATTWTISAPTATVHLASTSTPIPKVSVSPTHREPTATATLRADPMPTPTPQRDNCFPLVEKLPDEVTFDGVIALESIALEGNHYSSDTYFWNSQTGVREQIVPPNENFIHITESPDKRRLAYSRSTFDPNGGFLLSRDLIIAGTDGQPLYTYPWEEGWVQVAWLNNEQVIINAAGKSPEQTESLEPATLTMLDLATGVQRTLDPDFPGIYEDYPTVYWAAWGATVYDPTLTHVVYAHQHLDQGDAAYVLWDLQAQRPVTSVATSLFYAPPRWSPDGGQFVVAAPTNPDTLYTNPYSEDIYIVASNGSTVERLTALAQDHPNSSIRDYSWSPTGAYLAFWLIDRPAGGLPFDSGEESLVIVDTATGQITNTCIPGNNDSTRGPLSIGAPIWSPSGRQLITASGAADGSQRLVLVDLQQRQATFLDEDVQPVAWLSLDPNR